MSHAAPEQNGLFGARMTLTVAGRVEIRIGVMRGNYQIAALQLMTVRNGMYGQAHRMATRISSARAPAGWDPGGGGLSCLRRSPLGSPEPGHGGTA